MFIDASVVVAILNREVGFEALVGRMEAHRGKFYYSPLVRFEAVAAISRSRSGATRPTDKQFYAASDLVGQFFTDIAATEITITPTVGDKAISVAGRYGKFVGHEADLNFGDCYAYACAQAFNATLLYKGNDFSKTDLGKDRIE